MAGKPGTNELFGTKTFHYPPTTCTSKLLVEEGQAGTTCELVSDLLGKNLQAEQNSSQKKSKFASSSTHDFKDENNFSDGMDCFREKFHTYKASKNSRTTKLYSKLTDYIITSGS
uniref:Uncharacterized protein n=1 Tax=Romanomermis culicivorax TaxID=13658 RepID=A0A915JAV5_ROMCU